jgi:hypothetical protein
MLGSNCRLVVSSLPALFDEEDVRLVLSSQFLPAASGQTGPRSVTVNNVFGRRSVSGLGVVVRVPNVPGAHLPRSSIQTLCCPRLLPLLPDSDSAANSAPPDM